MDVTALLRPPSAPVQYPWIARGYIATTRPAPKAFSETVYVVLPEGSTEHLYGPCPFPAIHGATLPAQGAQVIVGFDEQHMPTILWWEGKQKSTAEPTGKAGGALAGEYPNPTLAAPEAWKKLSTLTYKNAWKDEAATPGEYRKTPLGSVELRGTITGGESGKEAFTLPAGYRPTKTEELGVLASLRNIAELNVTTAGVVAPFNGPTSEVKTYCTLHVFFSVE